MYSKIILVLVVRKVVIKFKLKERREEATGRRLVVEYIFSVV